VFSLGLHREWIQAPTIAQGGNLASVAAPTPPRAFQSDTTLLGRSGNVQTARDSQELAPQTLAIRGHHGACFEQHGAILCLLQLFALRTIVKGIRASSASASVSDHFTGSQPSGSISNASVSR
jgi:hypothetical protein